MSKSLQRQALNFYPLTLGPPKFLPMRNLIFLKFTMSQQYFQNFEEAKPTTQEAASVASYVATPLTSSSTPQVARIFFITATDTKLNTNFMLLIFINCNQNDVNNHTRSSVITLSNYFKMAFSINILWNSVQYGNHKINHFNKSPEFNANFSNLRYKAVKFIKNVINFLKLVLGRSIK